MVTTLVIICECILCVNQGATGLTQDCLEMAVKTSVCAYFMY